MIGYLLDSIFLEIKKHQNHKITLKIWNSFLYSVVFVAFVALAEVKSIRLNTVLCYSRILSSKHLSKAKRTTETSTHEKQCLSNILLFYYIKSLSCTLYYKIKSITLFLIKDPSNIVFA